MDAHAHALADRFEKATRPLLDLAREDGPAILLSRTADQAHVLASTGSPPVGTTFTRAEHPGLFGDRSEPVSLGFEGIATPADDVVLVTNGSRPSVQTVLPALSSLVACNTVARLSDERREQLALQLAFTRTTHPSASAVDTLDACVSPAMRNLLQQAQLVATSDAPVLLTGETGTGKEVLARALHAWSPRSESPFILLNCALTNPKDLEAVLFGVPGKPGRLQAAKGGTLLLDEVGALPRAAQSRILSLLEQTSPEVRILASSHLDLLDQTRAGGFLEALYYKLAVFPLRVPPLRDRRQDLQVLTSTLLDRFRRDGRGPWRLTNRAIAVLQERRWPGNIRQLANTLEHATFLCPRGDLGPEHFLADAPDPEAQEAPGLNTLADVQRAHIEHVLAHTSGKVYGRDGAAAILGLAPSTLQSRMQKLSIDHRPFRRRR